jgi:uncharacterized membrane protein YqjE
MADGEGPQGPATNLLRSVVQLGGTVLEAAQTRVELLTTELSEDLERGLQIVVWALIATLAGILGALLAGVTLIIYFWDTHRMAAAIGVTAVFLLSAAFAGLALRNRLHEKPRLLDATRSELRRDVAMIRSEE